MLQRQALRQSLLAKRRALTSAVQQLAARQLAERLIKTPLFLTSQHIAVYHAINGEMDPAPVVYHAHAQDKACYLPVLIEQQLQFAPYAPGEPLQRNHYQILEPAATNSVLADKLDLVLVPLVAFDQQGNRLGMGGGYYDRTFAFLQATKRPARPFLLGVAYSWQQAPEIPAEIWDVKLDAIATEEQIYLIKTVC